MGSWIEVAKCLAIGALVVGILPWFLNHPARGQAGARTQRAAVAGAHVMELLGIGRLEH